MCTSRSPADVCFLARDYRYKSLATQITHDAGLAPIAYTGIKSSPNGDRTSSTCRSTNLVQYDLNIVTMGLG